MDASSDNYWLDTETKACLQQTPPDKLAPAAIETFALVVLFCDSSIEPTRRVRAFDRVLRTSRTDAEFQTKRRIPFILKRELTLSDAMLGQFELICCGIVSVFIADTVISNAEPQYLADLYNSLIRSDEFAMVKLVVASVPQNDAGAAFLLQFIGEDMPVMPLTILTTRKKARIMVHWANKIGVVVNEL